MTAPTPLRDGRDPAVSTWHHVEIPGASPLVSLCVLGRDPTGGVTLLVRFPAGWQRPGPGHYNVAEEVLFLHGSFEMSGERYGADDHAWFPSGYTREASATPTGALALAWFGGEQQWFTTIADKSCEATAGTRRSRWWEQPLEPSPLGVDGHPLPRGYGARTWIIPLLSEAVAVTGDMAEVELIDLVSRRALHAGPGDQLPAVGPGPVWLRVFDAPKG